MKAGSFWGPKRELPSEDSTCPQKKQFMLLFSRLVSPGASPVGKRITTQSNALTTKTRMAKEARETQNETH